MFHWHQLDWEQRYHVSVQDTMSPGQDSMSPGQDSMSLGQDSMSPIHIVSWPVKHITLYPSPTLFLRHAHTRQRNENVRGYRTVNLASFPGLISKRTGLETRLTMHFRKAVQRWISWQEVISEKHSSCPVHTKVMNDSLQSSSSTEWRLELRSSVNDALS